MSNRFEVAALREVIANLVQRLLQVFDQPSLILIEEIEANLRSAKIVVVEKEVDDLIEPNDLAFRLLFSPELAGVMDCEFVQKCQQLAPRPPMLEFAPSRWIVPGHREGLAVLEVGGQCLKRVESGHLDGDETVDEGTAQQLNRSGGMSYHSDRPTDQMKLEARRFQEELRRALASSSKVTKPRK